MFIKCNIYRVLDAQLCAFDVMHLQRLQINIIIVFLYFFDLAITIFFSVKHKLFN